jgi:hypothetical protein
MKRTPSQGQFFSIILAVTSIVFSFLMIEMIYRVYENDYFLRNRVPSYAKLFNGEYPYSVSDKFGWDNNNYYESTDNYWGKKVTIGGMHNRLSNYDVPVRTQPSVMVFGDSFSFGEEVSNKMSWPAQLSSKLGEEAINMSVGGYGIDQIYLKAEYMINQYNPDLAIISFIEDDIRRIRFSYREAPKPYFMKKSMKTADDTFVVYDKHIGSFANKGKVNDYFKAVFGYSLVVNRIMSQFFKNYWYLNYIDNNFQQSGHVNKYNDFLELGCWIMNKVSDINSSKIVILPMTVAYPNNDQIKMMKDIVKCIPDRVDIINLRKQFNLVMKSDKEKYESFFSGNTSGHLNAKGNKFVADIVFDYLTDR